MANDTLQGWSRTTWSNGAFGVEGTVVVSGVQASNSSGSSSAIGTAGVPATGLQATGGVGQVSSFQSALVIPDGAVGAAEIGNAFASLPITVEVSGVEADTATEFGWGRGQYGLKVNGASQQAELVKFRLALGTL
jgi:hypothetical protein